MLASLSLRPIPYRLYQTPKLAFVIDISYSMSTFSFGLVIHDNWQVRGLGVGILSWPGSSFAWLTSGTGQGWKASPSGGCFFLIGS